MRTEELIRNLSTGLSPVRRIFPIWISFSGWIVFSFFSILFFVWTRSENFQSVHIPTVYFQMVLILLTVLSSSFFAMFVSIPGNRIKKEFIFLPFSLLIFWSLSLIFQLPVNVNDGRLLKMGSIYHACSKDIILMTIPIASVLLYLINRRNPILKSWIGFWILTASASAASIGVAFLCPNESSAHLLSFHLSTVIAFSIFGVILGRLLFRDI